MAPENCDPLETGYQSGIYVRPIEDQSGSHSHKLDVKGEINTLALVKRLMSHPLYDELRDEESLRIFMRSHVFCVWDFQSLLKALQRVVTCVEVPWLPCSV